MKKTLSLNSLFKQALNFANFYYQYKVETEKLYSVTYRVVTTLDEFKKSNLIQLCFSDNPGDLLAPMTIEKIKNTPDIMAGMHPIDINSINDLYYLTEDKIVKIIVEGNCIIAYKNNGESINYNVSENFNPDSVSSTRLSYMMGYMQAEKAIKEAFKSTNNRFKIIKDNISTLEILDINTKQNFLKNPLDILFSDEYKKFSKNDVARIGYICGQMSSI
jgi:hypothetical protein